MKEAIGIGETVELAREAACKQLGVESYEAEFEILQLPTKKTFGLFGGSPAKVRVYVEDDPAKIAADYLKNVLKHMGLENIEIEIKKEENGAMLSLTGDDVGYVIGHRGETLDALQYLACLVANHSGESYYRINLDIGNYRDKRSKTLEKLGKKLAEKSLRTGRNVSLEPMNPYERRIIHMAVQTVEGAKSWSVGEDTARHVVIGPIGGERPAARKNRKNGRRGGIKNRQPYRSRDTFSGGHKPVHEEQTVQAQQQKKTAPPLYSKFEPNK
ncbi:MAG: Single-stranded DNA-binding protein [Oscillospiraceae bacterium]|jgi:spoIIIJ-associated protein